MLYPIQAYGLQGPRSFHFAGQLLSRRSFSEGGSDTSMFCPLFISKIKTRFGIVQENLRKIKELINKPFLSKTCPPNSLP